MPPVIDLTTAVEHARDALREVLIALDARGTAALPTPDLGALRPDDAQVAIERLALVEQIGRIADAARVRAASALAFDTRLAEQLGHTDAASAVAAFAQVTIRTARGRLAVASGSTPDRALTGAPLPARYGQLSEALDRGALGIDAAIAITTELDAVAGRVDRASLAAAENLMVQRAAENAESIGIRVSVDHLIGELRQITATIDPDGARPREQRALRRRGFRLGAQDADGLVPVSGRLLPEVGGLLSGLMEAHRRSPRFRDESAPTDPTADARAARHLINADERAPFDTRTPDQRRHDAFAEIVTAAAAGGNAPQLDGAPVSVVVTVALTDLAAEHDGDGAGIGTMAGSSHPVSRASVHRFIDSFGLRVAALTAEGAVAGITSVQRCFTAAQRLAIAARDGLRCATPGCARPHYALQAHHVVPARDGGPTSTDNGILLCYWHHRRVDDGPWEYRFISGRPHLRGPGLLEWTPFNEPLARAA